MLDIAKRNVGALSDDITKAPYKVLMNSGTNSFVLLNSVMVVRNTEKILQLKKDRLTGRERLVAIHGNRFIAHCVLQQLSTDEGFSKGCLEKDALQITTQTIIDDLILPITNAINDLYVDSYPANIFKNATKCKNIFDLISKSDTQ